MKVYTGLRMVRKHGLDLFQVVVRNEVAHSFWSEVEAQRKLNYYNQQTLRD